MARPHVSRQLLRMQWLVRKIWALAKELGGAWAKAMAGLVWEVLAEVLTARVSTRVALISAVTRVSSSGSQGEVAGPTRPVCSRTTKELAAPHPDGHLAHDRLSSTRLNQL